MESHYKFISDIAVVLKQHGKTMKYATLKQALLDAGFGFSAGSSNNRGIARSVSAAWRRWNDKSDPTWDMRDAIATAFVNKWGIPAWKLYQLPTHEPVNEKESTQNEEVGELLGYDAQCGKCGENLTTTMRQFNGDDDVYVECSHCGHHNNLTKIQDDFMQGEMNMMYPDGLPDGWGED